ncbi:MAG: MiaB/RimO family radical SAM methylthiotransferase [Alphaproteobacteria bacterium]|nr:MiaB/RimO family radical SAM methylthiotransferase [Alphaproteobacteria bacterium]
MGVKVVNFGCRINWFETALIGQVWGSDASRGNTIVFNTCAVTAEAERQCLQAVRKARRENPAAQIVITGCASQINPAFAELGQVVTNQDKRKFFNIENALLSGFADRHRAFVEVQQGCDHGCTYCIVPLVRGRGVSVDPAHIVKQVRGLVDKGFKEVVVSGIDIASYHGGISGLVEKILREVPDLPRLRLSSLDPMGIDDRLVELFASYPALMPHLHLSAQSGDDLVLKRMGRRHTYADVLERAMALRRVRPDLVLGADFITGFPIETDQSFENTLDLVRRADIALLHVFPYSVRPQTRAAKMPQVPVAIRKERAKVLRALGDEKRLALKRGMVGKRASILLESGGRGYTEHYVDVGGLQGYPENSIIDSILTERILGI